MTALTEKLVANRAPQTNSRIQACEPVPSAENHVPGKISRFHLTQARVTGNGATTYDRQWSGSVANRKNLFRVLLIDDVAAMHRMVEDALEDIAEVRAADNGERGAQVAEQWHPDLIICDMLMPGLSGLETIIRIKAMEEVRNVPIILLSGVGEELKSFPALKDMVACIIPKPFELAQLKGRVEELLRKGTISSAAQANPPE